MKHSLNFRTTTKLEFWLKCKPDYTSINLGHMHPELEFYTDVKDVERSFYCIINTEGFYIILSTLLGGERYSISRVVNEGLDDYCLYDMLCELLTHVIVKVDNTYQTRMSIIELVVVLDEESL